MIVIIMKNSGAGRDKVWKSSSVVKLYLDGIRGAIPLAREQIDVMLRLIDERRQPTNSFMDLGCGDGILAAAILGQHPHAQGVLVDFSDPMLQSAKARLHAHQQKVIFKTLDYGEEGWTEAVKSSAPFDVIVSGLSIHHQPDERKRRVYAEIFDLLSPGGLFVNIEHVSSPTEWVGRVWNDYMIDSIYAAQNSKSREEIAYQYDTREDKAANILSPVEVQCDWLRHAGYSEVDCYLKIFEMAVFGGRRPE